MQKNNSIKRKSKTLNVMTFNMSQPSLIEASAGTGKTYTITNLVLRALLGVGKREYCLERPLEIDEFLIVTFTNAATSDLKARIYDRIRAARTCIEDFIKFVVDYIHSNNDLNQDGLVKNPKKIKKNPIIKTKQQVSYKDYSEEELQDLLVEINVEAALDKIGVDDQVFLDIIKDLLERNIVPLRQAALILTRAERKINQASISTIHSFCNSILTQLYALESGEAFNTELKNDLKDIEHEAYYQVWRRLFYQEHSSDLLLEKLNCSTPDSFINLIRKLMSVRLSSDNQGFYGFALYDFENYLKQNGFDIDVSKELEPQIYHFLKSLESNLDFIVTQSLALYNQFNEHDLAEFYDIESKTLSSKFYVEDKALLELKINGVKILDKLHAFLLAVNNLSKLENSSAPVCDQYKQDIIDLYKELLKEDYSIKTLLKAPKATKKLQDQLNVCVEQINGYLQKVDNLWVAQKNESAKCLNYLDISGNILNILVSILMIQEYEAKCKEQHVMSNDDVLRRLDHALNGRGSLSDNLAWAIRARYPLAMIDEFQDTDPVQFNIFSKIYLHKDAVDQKAYCYLIGDPKQSIYAFRGSDINSYLKAKNAIFQLTNGKGIYTLDTNYRSSVDVVEATNAIFSTTLNPLNYNPFNEANIPFTPVFSGKGKQLESKVQKDNSSLERDFILNGLDQYIDSDISADKSLGKLSFKGNANNYIVNVGKEFKNKSELNCAYARSTALLVKQILEKGFIVKNGEQIPVNSGDIAILVSSSYENDLIQNELWSLQIPSVYFSDQSSILVQKSNDQYGDESRTSTEALEIKYLMEAMCDCTNVRKLNRLLACKMLSLSSDEFAQFTSDEGIEKEVQLLSSCARTWESYGFLPAFMQWANDPYHNMEARLLELKNGERAYTNYCHIGEIVQKVHAQKVGNQTQMHWYNNLLENSLNEADPDQLKKRLESEHDQVKILTIHKSKGLEFPIVLTPFLWSLKSSNRNFSSGNNSVNSVKYYAQEPYDHVVLDFDTDRQLELQIAMPVLDNEGNYTGDIKDIHCTENNKTIAANETNKENTRLLYVALTRARYANFIFLGEYENKRKAEFYSALVNMQGKHELQNVIDQNHNVKQGLILEGLNTSEFIEAVKSHPELFTLINFESLFAQDEELSNEENSVEFEPLPFTTSDELLGDYDRRSLNHSSLPKNKQIPAFAQSFLYDDAIDKSFNIISYSSLTNDSKVYSNYHEASAQESDLMDRASVDDSIASQNLSSDESQYQQLNEMPLLAGLNINIGSTSLLAKEPSAPYEDWSSSNYSWSYQVQSNWRSNCYFIPEYTAAQWVSCSKKICYSFPRGANAGTCMHDILEHIQFEKIKEDGFKSYVIDKVMNEVVDNSRYSSLIRSISRDRENNKRLLAEWFNDVLEAPIVAGKHHCFALSDLKANSYEPEMRFLMSNERFKTSQLDIICRKVAKQLLPDDYQDYADSLTLSEDELVGYITGSIDLACRFDLNDSLQLRERGDLKKLLPQQSLQELSDGISKLKKYQLNQSSKLSKYDPELFNDASFKQVAALKMEQEGSKVKYYVIDYKSNYLGDDDSNYDDQHMLSAIYAHRYDVQFMIYTLALYRHLKRRFAIPFDATYDELEDFYNEHVGGAIYLFLRGMKANYNRNSISNGVFGIKLDFDVVYQLDMLFTIGNIDE